MLDISLHCVAGPLKGQTFRLDGGPVFIFGRYVKARFSLAADPAASHLHFLIDTSRENVRIIDLGSTNGLVINEKHLGGKLGAPFTDFVTLVPGDTVLAGSCLFRLTVTEKDTIFIAGLKDSAPAAGIAGKARPAKDNNLTTVMISKNTLPIDIEGGAEGAPPSSPEAGRDHDETGVLPMIEGYTILERIGGGGRGVVFKAIKDDSGATAAIKMMDFSRGKCKRHRSLEMFRREIQITRQLDHPNIIRYLGDGLSAGHPYLSIEFAGGGTLDGLIHGSAGGRLELPLAVPLFIQLLEAVGHMHGRNLVHRDIKPKNILLDIRRGGSYAVKLSDMGLSCRFSNQENDDFLPIVCEGGTPAYMPPEQLTDLTRAIPQSDVFSSAATFYQMMTGSLLYDFSSDRDQNETIIRGRIKPILELRADLPRPIADVIGKALSYGPDDRYSTAQKMLDDFKSALT